MQHDYILLDRSGSMVSLWVEAINSINAYVEKLKEEKVKTKITVAAFDGNNGLDFRILREGVKPAKWETIKQDEIAPRGMTPLNDATAKLVNMAKDAKPDKAAIIIMTDGHENTSQEFTVAQAKSLLDECRAKNWQVIFLGANFDNAAQASSYGNMRGQTISASAQNLAATMTATASMRSVYGMTGQSVEFSDEDKKKAVSQ